MTNITALNKLLQLNLSSCSDNEVRNLLAYFIENGIPAIQYKLPQYSIITRMREGTEHYMYNQLSYKPVEYCHLYQRATLPNETIFYGVITNNEDLEYARVVTIGECSSMCRNRKDKGVEYFTCSQWLTKYKLNLLGFFSDYSFEDCKNNNIISQIKPFFLETINKFPNQEENLKVMRFLSEQFFKPVEECNSYKYKISANLVSIIRILFPDVDGIIYPSGRVSGQFGVNVALFPHVADTSICFLKKAKLGLYKHHDIIVSRIEGYAEDIAQKFDDTLQFSDDILCQLLNVPSLIDLK